MFSGQTHSVRLFFSFEVIYRGPAWDSDLDPYFMEKITHNSSLLYL